MTSGGGDLDVLARDRVQPAEHAVGSLRVVGQRRHPELEQRLLDEGPVLVRDELGQVLGRALGRDPGGHDDVDAVRAPAGVGVHPVQGGVQLGRVVEPDRAEHPQAAGPADRGGDVLGRAEPDDGMLDAEQAAQGRPHGRAHLGVFDEWAPEVRSRPGAWLAAYARAQP